MTQGEYTVKVSGILILMLPFVAILASHAHEIVVIVHMSLGKGQTKGVSTCSSHLAVESLLHATTIST